jgi:hypothetical protein
LDENDRRDLEAAFAQIEQERQNTDEALESWELRYGFKHDCHCAEDVLNDKTVLAPECWAGAADQAFEKLGETRGVIFGILASPSTDAMAIKAELAKVFYGE